MCRSHVNNDKNSTRVHDNICGTNSLRYGGHGIVTMHMSLADTMCDHVLVLNMHDSKACVECIRCVNIHC